MSPWCLPSWNQGLCPVGMWVAKVPQQCFWPSTYILIDITALELENASLKATIVNKDKEIEIGKELREFKEFAGEFPPEVNKTVPA